MKNCKVWSAIRVIAAEDCIRCNRLIHFRRYSESWLVYSFHLQLYPLYTYPYLCKKFQVGIRFSVRSKEVQMNFIENLKQTSWNLYVIDEIYWKLLYTYSSGMSKVYNFFHIPASLYKDFIDAKASTQPTTSSRLQFGYWIVRFEKRLYFMDVDISSNIYYIVHLYKCVLYSFYVDIILLLQIKKNIWFLLIMISINEFYGDVISQKSVLPLTDFCLFTFFFFLHKEGSDLDLNNRILFEYWDLLIKGKIFSRSCGLMWYGICQKNLKNLDVLTWRNVYFSMNLQMMKYFSFQICHTSPYICVPSIIYWTTNTIKMWRLKTV